MGSPGNEMLYIITLVKQCLSFALTLYHNIYLFTPLRNSFHTLTVYLGIEDKLKTNLIFPKSLYLSNKIKETKQTMTVSPNLGNLCC